MSNQYPMTCPISQYTPVEGDQVIIRFTNGETLEGYVGEVLSTSHVCFLLHNNDNSDPIFNDYTGRGPAKFGQSNIALICDQQPNPRMVPELIRVYSSPQSPNNAQTYTTTTNPMVLPSTGNKATDKRLRDMLAKMAQMNGTPNVTIGPYTKENSAKKEKPKPKPPQIILDLEKLEEWVIDEKDKSEVVALLSQYKHSTKIFDAWGLSETIEYGKGMVMLFWGPPGTGKTWGANCIAKALKKDLLVVSAAEIQSSEPGGANRNIQNAFREAKSKNKVLFLDECDSLIASRDNLGMILSSEINTLLTEIERFEGVCILATNRIYEMDEALERRVQLTLEIGFPDKEKRFSIWKKLLPKKMPLDKDVDLEKLAEHELSGGFIKNVILQTARLAAADNATKVANKYFTQAIERVNKSKGLMGKKDRQRARIDYSTGRGTDAKYDVKRDIVSDDEIDELKEFLS